MNENYENEVVETKKGSFWIGILFGVIAYIVNILLFAVSMFIIKYISLMIESKAIFPPLSNGSFDSLIIITYVIAIYGLLISIPIIISSGVICKSSGKKRCLMFLLIATCIAFVISTACNGLINI